MLDFDEKMIAKAKIAKSVEELIILAKENNIELTEKKGQEYFNYLNGKTALSDDMLKDVGGGFRFDGPDDDTIRQEKEISNATGGYCSSEK